MPPENDTWQPRLLVYAESANSFELFQRASSRGFFEQFKVVIGVGDVEDLLTRFRKATEEKRFPQVGRWAESPERWSELMNLKVMGTK
jgi:hypothetical protein